ncbi:MAG TPA: hypothetical protein VG435_18350 [Acidimicrobiales bacterium]|nr:hypothetical protein [Acidimicrobiales bacterium]
MARGEWERPAVRVVRLAGSRETPEQRLMMALIEAGPGAVASHQSAAWLWALLPAPDRPAVTVPSVAPARQCHFDLHRLKVTPAISTRGDFPVTNPLRTVVDLAGVVGSDTLDEAVDRAVAKKLVTVEGLEAEMSRLAVRGRKGVGALRRSLRRRGLVEGVSPSVLEARFHRLLQTAGIVPLSVEVVTGPQGEFRLDTQIDPHVAVEADGQAFHSTPEQKGRDERRRNQIRTEGMFLLVYTWWDVIRDGRRVIAEIHRALFVHGQRSTTSA